MIKKLISIAAAAAMLCQLAVPAFAAPAAKAAGTVLNDDFSDGTDAGYEVYDEVNSTDPKLTVENGQLKFDETSGWNETNGIKKDITAALAEAGFKSGDTLSVSADVTSSWYNNAAVIFVEVNGVRTVLASGGPGGEAWTTATITGSAAVTCGAGDTVIFGINQPCGTHVYDNIVLTVGGEAPVETPGVTPAATPETKPTAAPTPGGSGEVGDVLFTDDFDSGDMTGYEAYDSTDMTVEMTAGEGTLGVKFGNDWSSDNGIRKDITDLVAAKGSGSEYEVSADIRTTWWGDTAAKLFLEVVSGTGAEKISIDEKLGEGDSGSVTLSGKCSLSFGDDDKVYLCVTQAAGYQYFDNITMKYTGKTAVATPEPTGAPTNAPGGVLFNDVFSSDAEGYSVYSSTDTAAEMAVGEGTLGVQFGNDWSSSNGVRKDITELVKANGSGSKYEASADVRTTWWGDTAAKLFLEVVSGTKTTKINIDEKVGEGESGSVTLSGTCDLRYNDGDKVYLCITQAAGYQYYDNVTMKYIGEADPEPTPDPAATPGPTEEPTPAPIEDAIFDDDFSDESQLEKYALYDANNTTSGAGITLNNGAMNASMGSEGWNTANGIRRDITDEISGYISGLTFGVQLELEAFWGDTNDVAGSVFFEVVGEDGTVSATTVTSILPTDGSEKASARGTGQINYKSGDKIYLCVTQMSGNHVYDNIVMWLDNTGVEGVIPLTSGTKYAGTYFPASAKAIYRDSFAGNAAAEMEKYSPYTDVEYTTAEPRDNGAFFQFPDGGALTRGVKVDVTDAIDANMPNGGLARFSCKMLPWYWWGPASVKVRVGDEVINADTFTSSTGDPNKTWVTIGGTVDIVRNAGEKVELIVSMDASSATGITIDDVTVELPYTDVAARDTAVTDASMLDRADTVSLVYGGEFVAETSVSWGEPEGNIVYGETGVKGITARAIITDGNVKKVSVSQSGVSVSDYKLEYGKTINASGAEGMVFLLDSTENLNLISAVSGAKPVSGSTDVSVPMSVRDNGHGVTIEGTAPEAANNDKIIVIKNAGGEIVGAEYVSIDADGKYSVEGSVPATGSYTAAMTDTGISTAFSYASSSEFDALKNKINSGESVGALLSDENNRVILGAHTYEQLDKLPETSRSGVYGEFAAELGNKSRAEAAALFDALVTIKAVDPAVSEAEWTPMLEASAGTLGLQGVSIYSQYKNLGSSNRASVKKKIASLNPADADSFRKAFEGAVLNTRLVSAGQYSNITAILKENADLFEGTGVDVNNIGVNAARYINSKITGDDITIDDIADLIKEALNSASSSSNNGGSGGSGGGGGGGSWNSPASSGGGILGSNVGLSNSPQYGLPLTQSSAAPVQQERFNDLAGFDWAKDAVIALSDKGIINGYGDGSFNPAGNVTREEFVKMIVAAFAIPAAPSDHEFGDVDAGRWSHDVIASASAAGIITGVTDTEFAPEANITRQDAAVIIYRALSYAGKTLSAGGADFTDGNDIAAYAAEAVTALSGAGIINGMEDGSFAPAALASRAQAAVMIHRVLNTL